MECIHSHLGSKGELYLPKRIREKLGLKPSADVVYIIKNNKLEVEKSRNKVQNVIAVLKRPKVASITHNEFEKWSENWQNKLFEKTKE